MSDLVAEAVFKISAARFKVIKDAPYVSAMLYALRPAYKADFPTLAVTKTGILIFGHEPVLRWSLKELAGVLYHEVWHLLRDHLTRGAHVEHRDLWDLAVDMEINDDIIDDWSLPDGPILPRLFGFSDGLLAEEYYAKMLSMSPPPEPPQRTGPGSGLCGTCSGGSPTPGTEEFETDVTIEREGGSTPQRLERIRGEVAESIRNYASGKSAGSVPSYMLRWADVKLDPPKVRWQDKLRRTCRNVVQWRPGAFDYTYERPSRRQWAFGYGAGSVILPSMRQPIPEIWFAGDTSASMGLDEGAAMLSEASEIVKLAGEVTFLSCDAALHEVKRCRSVREMTGAMKGGGGTDFRPVFEAIEKARVRPSVLIFATDGYGPAPDVPPRGVHVIWLLVGRNPTTPASWGTVIEVE